MAATAERFELSDINPNNAVGGGGCACSESYNEDSHGPYAVFYGVETDSNLSPHFVVCHGCAESFCCKIADGEDRVAAGEDDAPNEDQLTL